MAELGLRQVQVNPKIDWTFAKALRAMGLEQRFAQLAGKSDAATQAILSRQMARLAEEAQMGNLFKVLCAISPGDSAPYPFGDP